MPRRTELPVAGTGLETLFFDLRGLADAIAQVVQLRPAHGTAGDRLDASQHRRMHRERALDADAVADLAHGERLAHAGALTPDDDALEHLHALLVAFDDADVDLQRVAWGE